MKRAKNSSHNLYSPLLMRRAEERITKFSCLHCKERRNPSIQFLFLNCCGNSNLHFWWEEARGGHITTFSSTPLLNESREERIIQFSFRYWWRSGGAYHTNYITSLLIERARECITIFIPPLLHEEQIEERITQSLVHPTFVKGKRVERIIIMMGRGEEHITQFMIPPLLMEREEERIIQFSTVSGKRRLIYLNPFPPIFYVKGDHITKSVFFLCWKSGGTYNTIFIPQLLTGKRNTSYSLYSSIVDRKSRGTHCTTYIPILLMKRVVMHHIIFIPSPMM